MGVRGFISFKDVVMGTDYILNHRYNLELPGRNQITPSHERTKRMKRHSDVPIEKKKKSPPRHAVVHFSYTGIDLFS